MLALAASGCGNNNSKDAAGAAGAMAKAMNGSRFEFASQVQDMKKMVDGQKMLARFDAESRLTTPSCADYNSQTSTTCTAGSISVTAADGSTSSNVACTGSCPGGNSLSVACTFSGEVAEKCGATTYTFKNGSMNFTIPPATCDDSGDNVKVSLSFGLDFKLDFKGGDVADFTRFECSFSDSLVLSVPKSGTGTPSATSDISGSGSFSCTLGGKSIDQGDLAKAMTENAC
jgi:hypothetical protein